MYRNICLSERLNRSGIIMQEFSINEECVIRRTWDAQSQLYMYDIFCEHKYRNFEHSHIQFSELMNMFKTSTDRYDFELKFSKMWHKKS